MTRPSPKEISDDTLGLAMEAHALAICLDNMIFHNIGGIDELHIEFRNSLDGLAKALRRSTSGVVDQIEALDHSIDWPNATKDSPKLVNG